MAGSIQGLTVIINGDATRLTKAMREARAEAGIMRGHMTQLNKLLQFSPASATLLTRQQQLLSSSIAQTSERLAMLRSAYAQLAPTVSTMTAAQLRQLESLQREITSTELRMAELRAEAIRTGAAGSVAMQQWAARFGSVNAALSAVSTQLMMVSAVSGVIGYAAMKAAVDFESSFAGVRKTIIATEAEYKKLAADAIALSLVKPVDVNDINRIMELGGQLNIASQYLTKFAGVMADLNVSTDMGVDEGSLKLAQFINITGMAQNDVDRLGATIVDLGNNSATTENQIMLMAMRIAGASSNLGMSAQNTLALAASLSAVGIQAEMGGNAIATIMNKINKDVAYNNSSLVTWAQTAGMSANEFKESWSSNVTGTLLAVIRGMGEFRDEGNNLNILLKDMGISYMRQVDTMQRLSRAADLTTTLMARSNVAWDQNTALVRESTQRYSTAESKIQMMKNSITAMGIALGNQVLPAFSDFVQGVASTVQAFADMDDGAKQAIVNILLFATAIGPVSKVLQLMTGGISGAIKGLNMLKTAMALASAGQLTYTNMTIASSAATAADTAARAANMTTVASQQRGYAVLIAAKAAEAAASGESALATNLESMAKQLETLATENEARAEATNAAATLANAASKGILATAIGFANAQAVLFGTTLAITNLQLLGIVAVIAGLVIGIGALASTFNTVKDPLDRLSSSYSEQEQRVANLQAEYDALKSSESATSEEIWRAQAALDAESDSLEANSITVREFNANVARAAEEQAKMADNADDAMRAAENEAGAIGNLVDKIRDLAPTAKGNAEATQELQLAISQLNMLVPELNLAWDSVSGTLKSSVGAWDEVAEAAGKASVNATAVEQLSNWSIELTARTNDLAEAQANYDRVAETVPYDMLIDGTASLISEYAAVNETLQTAQDSWYEASQRAEHYGNVVKETASKQNAFTDVLGKLASGDIPDLDSALTYLSDQWGIVATKEELVAERESRVSDAMQEATANASQLVSEIEELTGKNETFAAALAMSGVSVEGLAAQLSSMGYSAEEVATGVTDVFKAAADGLNEIEVNSEVTLDKLFETLEHNREVVANWSSNLKELYNGAGAEYRNYIDYLRSLGPEYAQVVQDAYDEMTNDHEAFVNHAREYNEIMEADYKSSVEQFGIQSDNLSAFNEKAASSFGELYSKSSAKLGELTNKVKSEFSTAAQTAAQKAQEAAEGYSNGIASSTAPDAARAVANGVAANLDTVGDTYRIGQEAVNGVYRGLHDGIGLVEAAAAQIANAVAKVSEAKLQINSPSKVMQRIYSSVPEGAALGILGGIGEVRQASTLLAQASMPEASTMLMQVGARTSSAVSAQSAGAPQQGNSTVVNNYTIDGLTVAPDSVIAKAMDEVFSGAMTMQAKGAA